MKLTLWKKCHEEPVCHKSFLEKLNEAEGEEYVMP